MNLKSIFVAWWIYPALLACAPKNKPDAIQPDSPPSPEGPSAEKPSDANAAYKKIRDQFHKVFEGQFLEINTKKEGVDAKGCLFMSIYGEKCRWHLKGSTRGKLFELDFSGNCSIDPVSPSGNFQFDILVSKINLLNIDGEAKITDTVLDGHDSNAQKYSQTNMYYGELVQPLPNKIDSIVSSQTSPTSMKWVSDCKINP